MRPRPSPTSAHPVTLSIDVGGSGIKAMLLSPAGKPASEHERIATPAIPTPYAVLRVLNQLRARLRGFDRVSIGFPGVVKNGVVFTAVNLHPRWDDFPLERELHKRWRKPVRIANDAAVQGYGAVKGTAETWLRMQLAYDLAQARKKESAIKIRRLRAA